VHPSTNVIGKYHTGCEDVRVRFGGNYPSEPVGIYSMRLSTLRTDVVFGCMRVVPGVSSDRDVEIFLHITIIMRGKKVSTDLKYTILALGHYHTVSEIENLTAISRRQICRIRASWETSGCVEPEHTGGRRGRPRFLTTDQEAASFLLSLKNSAATEMES